MKQFIYAIVTLSLFVSGPVYAVTMVDEPVVSNSESASHESVVRTSLITRYADGKLDTTQGTLNIRGAEVVDNRPVNQWYVPNAGADVSLYYKDKRLVRVVIY